MQHLHHSNREHTSPPFFTIPATLSMFNLISLSSLTTSVSIIIVVLIVICTPPPIEALSEQNQHENFHYYDLNLPSAAAAAAAAASYFGRGAAVHEQLAFWSPIGSPLLNGPSSSSPHQQYHKTSPSVVAAAAAAQLVAANPEFGLNHPAPPTDRNSIANSIHNGIYQQNPSAVQHQQQTEVEYQQQNSQIQHNNNNNNNVQQQQAQHLQQEAEQLHELQQQQAQQTQQNQQQHFQQQQQTAEATLGAAPPAALIRPAAAPIHFQPQDIWPQPSQHNVFPTTTSYLAIHTTTPEPISEHNNNNNQHQAQQFSNLMHHGMSLSASQAVNAANFLSANHPNTWQHDALVAALMDPQHRDVAIMLLSIMTMSAGTTLPPAVLAFAGGGNNPSNSISPNNGASFIAAQHQQALIPPVSASSSSKQHGGRSEAAIMSDAVTAIEHHLQQQQQQQQKPANIFYGPPSHSSAPASGSNSGATREQHQQQQALLRQRHHLQQQMPPPSSNEIAQQQPIVSPQSAAAQQHNKKLQHQHQQRTISGEKQKVSQHVGALQAQATNSVVGGTIGNGGVAANGLRAAAPLIPTPCDSLGGAGSPGGMATMVDPNQPYCTLPGTAYPTAQVGNYIMENLSTMKRMAGSPRIPNREEDADQRHASDGQDQRKKRLAGTGTGTRGKYLCPATEELVTPFWANNATGARLAIVNSPPFEQAVHTVKCTRGAQGRCHPTRPCWCTQEYSWFRLLAYDPTDNCKGIFMEWFKFPSSCNCMCY